MHVNGQLHAPAALSMATKTCVTSEWKNGFGGEEGRNLSGKDFALAVLELKTAMYFLN